MSDGELTVQKEETAEEIKSRINAMKSGKSTEERTSVVEAPVVSPEESAQSTPEAPKPTATEAPAPVQTGQADDQSTAPSKGKPEIDHKEWARKKGIKDEESALRALRAAEQEITRKSMALKASEERNVPHVTIPPPWQPTPSFTPPPYQAPQPYPYPPMDRRAMLEKEAANYNMTPDDFEKVLKLSNDIAAINTRRLKAEYDGKLSEIEKENRRNSEMRELSQDPLFLNEEVQFEMHKVLEENPKALELEPMPRIWAFNEAQRRLARRYLQSDRSGQETSKNLIPPTKPPKEGSRSTDPGFAQPTESAVLEKFQKESADGMKKYLTSIGVRPTL